MKTGYFFLGLVSSGYCFIWKGWILTEIYDKCIKIWCKSKSGQTEIFKNIYNFEDLIVYTGMVEYQQRLDQEHKM